MPSKAPKAFKCNSKQPPTWTKESVYKKWVCPGLWKLTGPPEATGLSFLVLTTLFGVGAGERRMVGVLFKRSQRDKGIVLNYCPFCGSSLLAWRKAKVSKKAPPRKPLRKSS